ncbi:hypothetical protein A9Q84_04410 [Halobacteriovorax marinus]|uniref:AB hydrolase-1 domain-containing protein n=1 Tax=Halobacteriovorax marinus TaxID=97084 RepID=A0A1Y5FAM8_9BACT|nr:hypothetical protein A9Q84_04410 [Halobacteriovorax marinus]
MKSILFTLVTVLCLNTNAGVFPKAWLKAKHFDLRISQDIELKTVHMQNKEGRPVLFLHGYMATMHTFMDLASKLHGEGFDVYAANWNVDDRNIDESTRTIRQLVQYIYEKTNKKVLIIGHSLGAVTAKLTLYGLKADHNENASIDKQAIHWAKKRVRGLVSFSSPNGQEGQGDAGALSFLDKIPEDLIAMMGADLSDVINKKKILKQSIFVTAMHNILTNLRFLPIGDSLNGLFNLSNFKYFDNSLARFLLYGSVAASPELAAHVKLFMQEDRMSSFKNEINYTKLFFEAKNPVPFFYFAGENDVFSPAKSIIAEAQAHGEKYLVMKNAGHLDVMIGKHLPKVLESIVEFDKKL